MRRIRAVCLAFVLSVGASLPSEPRQPDAVPPNAWIELAEGMAADVDKPNASAWYSPVTDELILWGIPKKSYEVQTFSLSARAWADSLPRGKEQAWADGHVPPFPKDAKDGSVGIEYSRVPRISFWETDGVVRPTRIETWHQGCWDSKRNRVMFFLGGKTFTYDPVRREWTDLKADCPPTLEMLAQAAMAYDPVNDEVVLFGGMYAINPWGGAQTWLYSFEQGRWCRPELGCPELRAAWELLRRVREETRQIQVEVQYPAAGADLGKTAAQARDRAKGLKTRLVEVAQELQDYAGALGDPDFAAQAALGKGFVDRASASLDKAASLIAAETRWEAGNHMRDDLDVTLDHAMSALAVEPPLRAHASLAYDAGNRLAVLFGGNAEDRLLNDTWVYDVTKRRWHRRRPDPSPPPTDNSALTYVGKHGLVFLASGWIYDAAKNEWKAVKGETQPTGWHSVAYSEQHDLIVLTDSARRVSAYRLDPATAIDTGRRGAQPDAFEWYTEGRAPPASRLVPGLFRQPPPDRAAHIARLKALPENEIVALTQPAGVCDYRTGPAFGRALFDSRRGEIIYHGGGHVAYGGTDFSHYSVEDNRWSLSWPPKFPLHGMFNMMVPGWSYEMQMWPEHSYAQSCYDPASGMIVWVCRLWPQSQAPDGMTMLLARDYSKAFQFQWSKHGQLSWVYDPARRKVYPPVPGFPGRPQGFGDFGMCAVGTPRGVYAAYGSDLFRGTVTVDGERARIDWKRVAPRAPGTGQANYRAPLVYDSKRDRLLCVAGSASDVQVYALPLDGGEAWEKLNAVGRGPIDWNTAYIDKYHCLMALKPGGSDRGTTRSSSGELSVLELQSGRWRTLDLALPSGVGATLVYDPIHDLCLMTMNGRDYLTGGVAVLRLNPRTARYVSPDR